jgi:transcriptional regulator with XRE-family HTH domain
VLAWNHRILERVNIMFAQRVKELREQKGISQAELARDMDVTQSTVGNWEADVRRPTTKKMIQLAEYFSVSVDHLLGNETLDPQMILLTRRLKSLPENDREFLIDNFKNTIAVYLKSKGH